MGSPSIYVYDCSKAGIIIESFHTFSVQRENEMEVGSRQQYIYFCWFSFNQYWDNSVTYLAHLAKLTETW